MTRTLARRTTAAAVLASALALSACGVQAGARSNSDGDAAGDVAVDGSSTVYPLSSAAAELLAEQSPDIRVTVGESGTGGGFEAFCQGKTDVSDASRPIEDDEAAACKKAGVDYTQLQVGIDALTVVVHKDLDIDCLTVDQLRKIWEPGAEGEVTSWKDVDASFPDEKISLFGPGTDSGTFDYFTQAINGEEGASRTDYESSEDDNVIVQGVAGTPGAMGYFGYSYYEENSDKLKALAVDSGKGCVAPSADTARDGSYAPLSRPLFIYVNQASYEKKKQVAAYVDFYVDHLGEAADAAQLIGLDDQQAARTKSALAGMKG